MKELAVSYSDEKGQEIKLTASDIVEYISTDSSVTEKEVFTFLNMCKYLKLNPFLKEIYLIKYKDSPATFVISYQTLLKRAEENKNFNGYETEVKGEIPNMSATATVYRKDRSYPVKITVNYSEAVKTVLDRQTKELRPTNMWKSMPEWMLRKVALARALKEAFPSAVGNAQVSVSEIVDIDSDDKRVQEEIKEGDGQKAIDEMYGASEEPVLNSFQEEAKEGKLKLYEILKEKKIDTLAKVKEILKEALPDENWSNIKKDVFEKMPEEKLQQVIEYLK
ncbi:MAG: phage recombination protein Bet [Caldiserica bacterium]|nr:phage recombination protein Bet [Caldisericota bacterium]